MVFTRSTGRFRDPDYDWTYHRIWMHLRRLSAIADLCSASSYNPDLNGGTEKGGVECFSSLIFLPAAISYKTIAWQWPLITVVWSQACSSWVVFFDFVTGKRGGCREGKISAMADYLSDVHPNQVAYVRLQVDGKKGVHWVENEKAAIARNKRHVWTERKTNDISIFFNSMPLGKQ